jgi:hypothetical protein
MVQWPASFWTAIGVLILDETLCSGLLVQIHQAKQTM